MAHFGFCFLSNPQGKKGFYIFKEGRGGDRRGRKEEKEAKDRDQCSQQTKYFSPGPLQKISTLLCSTLKPEIRNLIYTFLNTINFRNKPIPPKVHLPAPLSLQQLYHKSLLFFFKGAQEKSDSKQVPVLVFLPPSWAPAPPPPHHTHAKRGSKVQRLVKTAFGINHDVSVQYAI